MILLFKVASLSSIRLSRNWPRQNVESFLILLFQHTRLIHCHSAFNVFFWVRHPCLHDFFLSLSLCHLWPQLSPAFSPDLPASTTVPLRSIIHTAAQVIALKGKTEFHFKNLSLTDWNPSMTYHCIDVEIHDPKKKKKKKRNPWSWLAFLLESTFIFMRNVGLWFSCNIFVWFWHSW